MSAPSRTTAAKRQTNPAMPKAWISTLARMLPVPPSNHLARIVVERNITSFRRGWLLLISGFLEPVLYLFSIGIGVGALIGTVTTESGRVVEYASFVAPAMMATSAMNAAVMDCTFNLFGKLRWQKLYDAMLATPMGPRDIAIGEIGWSLMRGGLYSFAFLAIAALMGKVHSWWALLALPAATLIGFAFAAVSMYFTTFMRSWTDFDYINLVTQPMIMFSATFFPLAVYAEPLQWLVRISPLYQAVVLERSLFLGEFGRPTAIAVVYLLVMGLLGVWGSARRIAHLLLK